MLFQVHLFLQWNYFLALCETRPLKVDLSKFTQTTAAICRTPQTDMDKNKMDMEQNVARAIQQSQCNH